MSEGFLNTERRMAIVFTASTTFSVTEIDEAISSMPAAGLIRLSKVAVAFGRGVIDPDDLLHEAFLSALEGRRKCPRDVDVVRFLAQAMRSIACNHLKSLSQLPEIYSISTGNNDDEVGLDPACGRPNAEETVISDQEVVEIKSVILSLFKDDEMAHIMVEGSMEGMEAEDLYDLTHLDKTAFASKRRLIRRRIDGAFPEGWKI
jgi:DNA-directed RNA polymerase specialized sigma24 family protein